MRAGRRGLPAGTLVSPARADAVLRRKYLLERASDLEHGAKPCSWDLLHAIRKLVESHDASLLEQPVQDASGMVHMAKLVYPIEGECQAVTCCGRALSMPWLLVDKDPSCMACIASRTE